MARHFVRLPTMATITALPRERSSMGALIGALARAEEFASIMLRRWAELCVLLCRCARLCRAQNVCAPPSSARPLAAMLFGGPIPPPPLRRSSEKKLLNTINHRPYSEGGCRFPVLEAAADPGAQAKQQGGPAPRKVKARIQTAADKIQILVGEGGGASSGVRAQARGKGGLHSGGGD